MELLQWLQLTMRYSLDQPCPGRRINDYSAASLSLPASLPPSPKASSVIIPNKTARKPENTFHTYEKCKNQTDNSNANANNSTTGPNQEAAEGGPKTAPHSGRGDHAPVAAQQGRGAARTQPWGQPRAAQAVQRSPQAPRGDQVGELKMEWGGVEWGGMNGTEWNRMECIAYDIPV